VVEEQDFSSNEDMSDIEQIPGDDDRQARLHKFVRGPMRPSFSGRVSDCFVFVFYCDIVDVSCKSLWAFCL